MYVCMYIYIYTYTPSSGMARSYIVVLFLDTVFHTVFHNGCTNLQSHQQYTSVLFPYILDNIQFLQTFNDIYLNRCEIIAHHCCDLYFSDSEIEHFFIGCVHLYVFLGKISIQSSQLFQIGFLWGFISRYIQTVYKFQVFTPADHVICKYFLPFSMLTFHSVNGFFCLTKPFKFNYVQFIYFCFISFPLGDRIWIQKSAAMIYVKEFSVFIFFQFYSFSFYI